MNDKVKGFILSTSDYKDNDLIYQVLTKEYGIISLVGKGAKKINAKNRYMAMCIYEFLFDYKDNKTIFTLKNGKILNSFIDNEDIYLISFKNIFIEACIKSKEIINENYYDNLSFLFLNLDKDNMYLLGSLFFSFLLKDYGIMPSVDGCLICDNKQVVALSNKYGGFLCQKHADKGKIYDPDTLRKFRHVIKKEIYDYKIILENDSIFTDKDFELVVDFFIDNSDIRLKSYEFYKKI